MHPFPDVAGHVEQAVAVRRVRPARSGTACRTLRRIAQKVREIAIETLAPGIALALETAARGFFPLGFGRQTDAPSGLRGQPRAIRDGILPANQRHGVIEPSLGRIGIGPHVRLTGALEHLLTIAGAGSHDNRQLVDGGGAMAGPLNEMRVLAVGDRMYADQKLIHVDRMWRPFILLCSV